MQTGATRKDRRRCLTVDARFAVYMDGPGTEPSYVLQGRGALSPVFDDLNRYQATMHFNGLSTVTGDGDRARGKSYTIAHHVFAEADNRQIMVAWLCYLDVSSKIDMAWCFAERALSLEWSETRALNTPAD